MLSFESQQAAERGLTLLPIRPRHLIVVRASLSQANRLLCEAEDKQRAEWRAAQKAEVDAVQTLIRPTVGRFAVGNVVLGPRGCVLNNLVPRGTRALCV